MFHFRSQDIVVIGALRGARLAQPALPGEPRQDGGGRGRHAQALAYAAQRRRAAQACRRLNNGVDAAYWKAGAPAALARALTIRLDEGLARLP
jgi:hypothetical protein